MRKNSGVVPCTLVLADGQLFGGIVEQHAAQAVAGILRQGIGSGKSRQHSVALDVGEAQPLGDAERILLDTAAERRKARHRRNLSLRGV